MPVSQRQLVNYLGNFKVAELKELSKYFNVRVTRQNGGGACTKNELIWQLVGGESDDAFSFTNPMHPGVIVRFADDSHGLNQKADADKEAAAKAKAEAAARSKLVTQLVKIEKYSLEEAEGAIRAVGLDEAAARSHIAMIRHRQERAGAHHNVDLGVWDKANPVDSRASRAAELIQKHVRKEFARESANEYWINVAKEEDRHSTGRRYLSKMPEDPRGWVRDLVGTRAPHRGPNITWPVQLFRELWIEKQRLLKYNQNLRSEKIQTILNECIVPEFNNNVPMLLITQLDLLYAGALGPLNFRQFKDIDLGGGDQKLFLEIIEETHKSSSADQIFLNYFAPPKKKSMRSRFSRKDKDLIQGLPQDDFITGTEYCCDDTKRKDNYKKLKKYYDAATRFGLILITGGDDKSRMDKLNKFKEAAKRLKSLYEHRVPRASTNDPNDSYKIGVLALKFCKIVDAMRALQISSETELIGKSAEHFVKHEMTTHPDASCLIISIGSTDVHFIRYPNLTSEDSHNPRKMLPVVLSNWTHQLSDEIKDSRTSIAGIVSPNKSVSKPVTILIFGGSFEFGLDIHKLGRYLNVHDHTNKDLVLTKLYTREITLSELKTFMNNDEKGQLNKKILDDYLIPTFDWSSWPPKKFRIYVSDRTNFN